MKTLYASNGMRLIQQAAQLLSESACKASTWLLTLWTIGLTCATSYAGGTLAVEVYSCPSTVQLNQLVDVTVRLKFSGDDNDGPWQVTSIVLRDDDIWPAYNTIRPVANPLKISTQGQWYSYTFSSVKLSDFDDGGDGIELYAWAEVDDNDWNGYNPDGSSAIKKVTVDYPKPDLVVTAVWTEPTSPVQGQSYVVKATVKNQDKATASAGALSNIECFMYLGGSKVGEGNFDDLAAGQSVTVSSGNLTAPASGTYLLKAKADGNSEITESSEGNNELAGNNVVVKTPPMPDLVVTTVWTEPASPVEGQSYVVKATVKNQGDAAANPTGVDQYINVRFYLGETDLGGETDWCTSIGINSSYTFTSGSKTGPAPTTYTIKAVADSQGDVAERIEVNNEKTANITVSPKPKPDLVVTAIWTEPVSPVEGQSYVVKATVKNQDKATASAGALSNIECFMYLGGSKVGEGNFDDLAAGQSVTVSSGNLTAPASGTYPLKARADGNSEISESAEGNNELAGNNVIVQLPPMPDLVVTAVWTEPTSPVQGQSYVVKATVKNQGVASANPTGLDQYINVRFYLGVTDLGGETDWCISIGTSASYTFTSGSKTAPNPNPYLIKAVADSQGDVAESDEGNNEKTNNITVLPQPEILSAYWWAPLDNRQGVKVTMCAEVKNMNIGDRCTFKVFEDDDLSQDDQVGAVLTGGVYPSDGKLYVKAEWIAAWQEDGVLGVAGDPEFYFEVANGGVKSTSSKNHSEELRVRRPMTPTFTKGDFEYSSATKGDPDCEETLVDGRVPIILLHGNGSDGRMASQNYWHWWLQRFNEPGLRSKYKVYRYVYTSSRHIDANGADFARFVNGWGEFRGRQVIILAHSMGGLVARNAMNSNPELREKTLRLITLGTPHFGSPGANPTWVYTSLASAALGEFMTAIEKYSFDGSQGDFDLGWHNPTELPILAASPVPMMKAHALYDDALLDNSLSNPFCGTDIMDSTDADAKITALGGSFLTLLDGLGNESGEEISDEVGLDHAKLWAAMGAMATMQKRNGSLVGRNDGLVPIESALLGSSHIGIRKIDLTEDYDLDIDHSAYLDIRNVIETVIDRLEELTQPISIGGQVTQNASGLPGVVVSGLPGDPTTDASGTYTATVPFGWSGTLTPSKAGYTFVPRSRSYTNLTASQLGQVFAASVSTGSILVTIEPQGAIDGGAKWRVDEGPWQNTGTTVSNIAPGTRIIEFNQIVGWLTPAPLSATVIAGELATGSGTYTLDPSPPVIDPPEITPNGLVIRWASGYRLQSAPEATGPWQVENATSPMTFKPTEEKRFYRLVRP